MNTRAGILKIGLAGLLFLLWWRGYLSDVIGQAGAALASPPAKVPFRAPGSGLPALNPREPG